MSERGVIVVGAGKRVLEAALPAFARSGGRFRVRRIYARSPRVLDAAGGPFRVEALAALDDAALSEADLVYLCVPKDAIPAVLAEVVRRDVAGHDLLIDTPVVRFKHFRHARHCSAFRSAWVPEDSAYLPWIEVARAAVGAVREVLLLNAAYAYHGLATARALLAAGRVQVGRRRKLAKDEAWREVRFRGGGRLEVLEPRRYDLGRVVVRGADAVAASHPSEQRAALAIVPELDGECVRAVRCGDAVDELDDDESALTAGDPRSAGIVARQAAFKRVGFLRLLRALHAGRGAYPLEHALEDTVVDYHLEKFGLYRANPLTSPHWRSGRLFLGALSRLGG